MDGLGVDGSRMAEVIPFPKARGPATGAGDAGMERLARATAALAAAVAAQREAVAGWRASLSTLDGTTRALQASLGEYAGRLDRVQGEVRAVGEAARGLEAWADGVLAGDQRGK
jgi:hypothetical protein